MNSTLKPVLPTAQTTSSTPNKPMHPQGAPVSYGQPSGPIPQNPFPNTNMAHNSASQQNHFSLSSGSPFNIGSIPTSNHPVAISQPSSGQVYNQSKNVSYSSGFQNAQNQNTLPPVSQALPATTSPTPTPTPIQNSSTTQSMSNSTQSKEPSDELEKPQPNGTTQGRSALETEKSNSQENHVTPEPESADEPKQDTTPPTPSQEKTSEGPTPSTEPLNKKNEVDKDKESVKEQNSLEPAPVPEPSPSPVPVSASTTPTVSVPKTADVPETSSAPVSEPAESSILKEAEEPETVQNDTDAESSKEILETDPLAIETTDAKHDQDKSVTPTETESKDEGSEDEEQSSDDASEKFDEDPVDKTPPKTPARKTKLVKQELKTETKTPIQKTPGTGHTKRQRIMTQHYQSPLPEIEIITKITSSTPRNKNNDDKLIYFYKNEFLAVRNTEGGFYLCQAVQNIYKSSSKIKIRWLSQDRTDKSGEIYTPDFYDLTDFDCILTSIDLKRVSKGRYKLKPKEKERTDSILKRCLAVEKGEISQPSVSEEHPDGLDLSLYKDEEQLMKNKNRGTKRKSQPRTESPRKQVPTRKAPETPKVRKVESKPARNSSPSKKVTPVKKPVETEPKKTPATSRSARGRRKSDTKTSPVVDPKKAKVLARIGRKAAVPASNSKQTPKSAKVSKPTPSTSKVTKPAPASSKPPPRRAAKRSPRK